MLQVNASPKILVVGKKKFERKTSLGSRGRVVISIRKSYYSIRFP